MTYESISSMGNSTVALPHVRIRVIRYKKTYGTTRSIERVKVTVVEKVKLMELPEENLSEVDRKISILLKFSRK